MNISRLTVAGLSGGSGKTTVSLGLARIFSRRSLRVVPFKKGPDYIDTAWLGLAAGSAASNLDLFFQDEASLLAHFRAWSGDAELALIEGNRGFFDGRDLAGSCSTAELARQLSCPVILVLDCTKMTRTAAALVAGCRSFPGGERIAGVIINRSGGLRHAALVRRAVEELAGAPVLGVLPRLDEAPIRERREGLVTVEAHQAAEAALDRIAAFVADHVDTDAALSLARGASPLPGPLPEPAESVQSSRARIGVVRDSAIWQYYAANLRALRDAGASLVPVSILDAAPWPDLDGLYIGGGDLAPYAAAIAANSGIRSHVADMAASGLPIYAEQAGFFFLGESLASGGTVRPMAGIFPIRVTLTDAPGSLGYVEARSRADTLFYPAGMTIRGHAYHYAEVAGLDGGALLERSVGAARAGSGDGLLRYAAFGACMQIFAPAVPHWAAGFVAAASRG